MVDTSASESPAVQKDAFTLEKVLTDEFNLLHGPKPALDDCKLSTLYEKIHALVDGGNGRSALCLSGGGIRSASFGLGVLQALTRRKMLFEFDYLSTVSGGGYIGGWLSAWRKRVPDSTVAKGLTENIPDRYNEPPELAELRANSNYLTPKLGVMSADTWTLAALYLRNLLLNWLIFLPAIIVVLLAPILSHNLLRLAAAELVDRPHCVAWTAVLLLFIALTVSASGRFDRGKVRVSQGEYLWFMLLPTYVAAMLLSFSAISGHGDDIGPVTGAIIGFLLYGAAWLAAFASRKPRTPVSASTSTDPNFFGLLVFWVIAGAFAGGLIGYGYTLVPHGPSKDVDLRLIVVFGTGWVALSMFLAELVYLGASSYSRKGDIEREWLARSSGWFVVLSLAWAAVAALVLYAHDIIGAVWGIWPVLIAGGSAGIAGSWIGSSAKTLATAAGKRVESFSMTKILSLATVIFLAALTILLSNVLQAALCYLDVNSYTARCPSMDPTRHALVAGWAVAASGVATAFFALFVNVNRFSSHSIYRNRLIRAFLGAARAETVPIPGTTRTEPKGSPTRDPFTGFDTEDNLRMSKLAGGDAKDAAQSPGLFHVVNMALNVVGGQNLAWQERKAESFVATPRVSGNDSTGFWRTYDYASTTGGLTLGTAMAISGAAASPNQGYHSSPLVGLLMTLFNVRLGWWLGNPSRPKAAGREGPRWGIVQIFQELFGLTTNRSKYIYLSDGGHFENLGIYEMVRRRCHLIVASDAGCDLDCEFEDLGNAVRKVWIDLGVQIDFEKIDIKKRSAELPGLYCAIGKIRYPECKGKKRTRNGKEEDDVGYLLYLKPSFRTDGSQPADVTAYGLKNPDFPHESTADQFFSESQMESYRSLGSHIIDVVFGPVENSTPRPSHPTSAVGPYWSHIENYVTPKPKAH